MLTIEDVASVPLFAELPAVEIERLARTSADLHLASGEFAVHEGGERALFAVLSGKMEVIKTFDGVERTLGWRVPGTIFGEVPIALGTPFPGGYRAAEPSRVMRVDIQQYYAVAAACRDISLKLSALARERLGGLQNIASEPHKPRVTLVGHRFDTACGSLRRFLARNQISFNWLTPDAPEVASFGPGARPKGDGFVLRFPDGELLAAPDVRVVASRLGLQTSARFDEYDVAIVGGGPAGLAAAVYGASEGLNVLVIEASAPGGQAGSSSRIENYLGFPSGISGQDLTARAWAQAQRFGADLMIARNGQRLQCERRPYAVEMSDGVRVQARAVIIATGARYRKLPVTSLSRFEGAGVYYGATPMEQQLCQGQEVVVVGGGNSAGQAAVFLAETCARVHLLVRGDGLAESMSRYLIRRIEDNPVISLSTRSEIVAVEGDYHLERVEWRDNRAGTLEARAIRHIFVMTGATPCSDWLEGCLALDAQGFIKTGADLSSEDLATAKWPMGRVPHHLETTLPGVFAVGDVRSRNIKRVASAVGEGSTAVAFVHRVLQE